MYIEKEIEKTTLRNIKAVQTNQNLRNSFQNSNHFGSRGAGTLIKILKGEETI